MMRELTFEECTQVGGGLTWDSSTCGGVYTLGGIVIGGIAGGLVGAGVGGAVGSWMGDNFCPAPQPRQTYR